jgi:hypothetical protein
MNKAKLIKRADWQEQKLAAQQQAKLAAATLAKIDSVKDWVVQFQAIPKPNARKIFDALFGEPQTS